MSKFFIEREKIQKGRIIFPEDTAHYIKRVLRLHLGDQIEIASEGKNYQARISRLDADVVEAELVAETASCAEPPLDIYLLQGLPKGEKLELIIQKSVELGVKAVYPMQCRRSIPAWQPQKVQAKQERLQKVAASAAAQCGRDMVPQIAPLQSLKDAIDSLPPDTVLIMPWEEAEEHSLKKLLAQAPPKRVAYMIGPEGGFAKEEVEIAKEKGAHIVTLGSRILRTETAAIVTLALLLYAWGDLGGVGS